MLTWFLSNHCILALNENGMNEAKTQKIVGIMSPNGQTSLKCHVSQVKLHKGLSDNIFHITGSNYKNSYNFIKSLLMDSMILG